MKSWCAGVAAVIFTMVGTTAQAGVIVGGTRMIYDGGKKEASITIGNPDKNSYLIQSWVDGAVAGKETKAEKAPFIVTPPLFRLDSNQQNILRIVRAGGALPEDRESLFWLNIKSIPSAEKKENTLQIAVKTRIKLIYRPTGVKSTPEETAKTIAWKRVGDHLQVMNPTPHYITFFNVRLDGTVLKGVPMAAPHSETRFDLPSHLTGKNLSWQFINDYGGISKAMTATL